MGIKGRRKRLRERETKTTECEPNDGDIHGDHDDLWNDYSGGSVAVMGDGPLRPPVDAHGRLHVKNTDLYNIHDKEYLERVREEHLNRRTSHLRKRQRLGNADEDVAEADTLLQHHYSSEDALPFSRRGAVCVSGDSENKNSSKNGSNGAVERRCQTVSGARFDHPLIGIDPAVAHGLQCNGFHRMTRIQERVIPYALQGYDLLGQAKTGSGKTLAFCVPVLHVIRPLVQKRPKAMFALLMAPTKELCVQTHNVLQNICQHIKSEDAMISVQLITGGTKVVEERRLLAAGASIVVGTPGRVHDHVQHMKGWDLSRLRFLVLDEADRMLADGFQRDLDAIVQRLPHSRQTFLFSATNSKSVRELARLSLSRTPLFIGTTGSAPVPVQVNEQQSQQQDGVAISTPQELPPYISYEDPVSEEDEENDKEGDMEEVGLDDYDEHSMGSGKRSDGEDDAEAIPTSLRQFCHIMPVKQRLICLYTFLKLVARTSKAMVFCSTIASTTFHFQMMGSIGFHNDVMMLHGHMKHRQRVAAFQAFNEWETGVLFCTDVAARGLDIPNVEWILQYDPPLDPTEYIHRIGRTARAGNVGNALLFLTHEEVGFVRYLSKFNITLEKYPMPTKLPNIQIKLEHVLQIDPIVAKSAISAYRAHVGAYQSHLLKETFNIRKLDLEGLAQSFALTSAPSVTLPKNTAEEKRQEYVKGKLKSLNKRRTEALKYYESQKTKQQWTPDGYFVGIASPRM